MSDSDDNVPLAVLKNKVKREDSLFDKDSDDGAPVSRPAKKP